MKVQLKILRNTLLFVFINILRTFSFFLFSEIIIVILQAHSL